MVKKMVKKMVVKGKKKDDIKPEGSGRNNTLKKSLKILLKKYGF